MLIWGPQTSHLLHFGRKKHFYQKRPRLLNPNFTQENQKKLMSRTDRSTFRTEFIGTPADT